MTDTKLDAKLQEIAGRAWRHVSALERGIHDNGSPVILAALREAVEAAVAQEREAIRKQIDADCCRTYRCYHRMTAWLNARSRTEEQK